MCLASGLHLGESDTYVDKRFYSCSYGTVSPRNDVIAGNKAYFCPLGPPHESQIWAVVPDP